jgi:hypothetical protein
LNSKPSKTVHVDEAPRFRGREARVQIPGPDQHLECKPDAEDGLFKAMTSSHIATDVDPSWLVWHSLVCARRVAVGAPEDVELLLDG